MTTQYQISEEVRALNLQINGQLKRAGVINKTCRKELKPLDSFPESEWKSWIKELIKIRDEKQSLLN